MGYPEAWGYSEKNVDDAREKILGDLQRASNMKVFYVDGWNGFGANPVLRSIAAVLPSRKTTPELCFDRIIFIDCSEWKNSRTMQREIAKELKLDSSVMAIFDKQDEEDDFHGVGQGPRDVILSIAVMIHQTLISDRFMMIFLNGSDDEVEITRLGVPQFTEFGNNMLIWTFSRRCLTLNNNRYQLRNSLVYTHVLMYSRQHIEELTSSEFRGLLRQQAADIIARIPCMLETDPKMVEDCCLYELFLYNNFHTTTKFSWVAHASNYWICDAIIQGDRANDISNALRQEINWKRDASLPESVIAMLMKHLEPLFLVLKDDDVYEEGPYRWISVTSRNTEVHGIQTVPAVASSFFLAFEESDHPPTLPNGFFENSSKLGVLVLCSCAFNFASPPFRKCHNLKFLGLDHCTHRETAEAENHKEWTCLHSLMVLDLRYTEWNEILSGGKINVMTKIRELNIEGVRCWQYVAQLIGRLPKLQRLRITKPPTSPWEMSNDVDDSFTDKTSMEILDLTGNSDMKTLPRSLSKASSLQMLVLDGCVGLENVGVPGQLPATLKSFSFDGYGPAAQRTPAVEPSVEYFWPPTEEEEEEGTDITEDEEDTSEDEEDIREDGKHIITSTISLEGCTQLDTLFVRGLNNLVELDLSGTAIKILDFNTMVVQVPKLKRLFLIGCKHLRAIIFLSDDDDYELVKSYRELKPRLELLCVDTRAGIVCPRPSNNMTKSFRLQVHAIVVDARLTHSLYRLVHPYTRWDKIKDINYNIHVTSSPMYDGLVQFDESNNDKIDHCDQGSMQQLIPTGQYNDVLSIVGDPPMSAFPQPPATRLDRHIEIGEGSCYVESGLEGKLGILMGSAESLHLHDVSIQLSSTVPKAQKALSGDIPPNLVNRWRKLSWCCVERCPKLDTVFPWVSDGWLQFETFETFWASDLLMTRWIWSKGSRNDYSTGSYSHSFRNFQHLHLRSCPSLQFVLPVWVSSFLCLETLHIIHCGDLGHVFIVDEEYPTKIPTNGIVFQKLKTIHLHDLPKLHQICEVKMVAPALESIKIRGCWSLRRLPSVAARAQGEKKPTIEIEKDVWDALEWDADHRPDHFEAPIHSRHYKKKLPRVSFLR